MEWFNRGNVIKVLALLLAVLAFWGYEVKGPDYEVEYGDRVAVGGTEDR